MAAPESDKTEYDGVAVQVFASWDEFLAMLGEPDAQLMRDDEANFLDRDKLKVVFSDPSVNVLDS